MKRRVLSLVIALALCLNLCPTWGLAAAAQSDAVRDGSKFTEDVTVTSPHVVSGSVTIDTDVYTLTASNSTAIQVTRTGTLDLRGRVISRGGSGVEVQNGGSLRITESGTQINSVGGYGLDIASGATVYLSAGRYTGTSAAIRTADNNFASLLAEGCAYFADDGTPILDIGTATVVNVGPCAHSEKRYTQTSGTTSHDWTCPFCGMTGEDEPCTVVFNQETGAGTCACGNSLQITVDERGLSDLVYDGTLKPENIPVTVTLTDGSNKELVKDTDYSVNYVPRTDAGEITVTVTGITFKGTFTKTYTVEQDRPGITWDTSVKPVPVEVDYDGSPVEAGDLPPVKINIQSTVDHLENYLQYSYKKQGDPDYTDGLPTNAGTYDVIASLPAMPNFEAAVSEAITLTICKIDPIDTAPVATTPTFNYTAQELVTAGTLKDVAVQDGLQIEFATSETGTYSTTIPTETNAGEYHVWYRVEGSDNNYIIAGPAEVSDVKILLKSITPTVEVLEPSYTYDGSKKAPQITVKDGNIVIDPVGQYTVTWTGTKGQAESDILRVVDTYTATITSTASGNYAFTATTKVEIVNAEQGALTITGQPEHVYYGDTITTLRTTGGTGDGEVKWSITAGGGSAEIVEATGVLTVKGTGSVTVKAERVVPNYGTVSDTWTFTVKPKPVLAEVTVEPKDYDGTTTIGNGKITAAVKSSDLVNGDTVTLSGLTGSYADPNAGTGKTVTLDDTNATKTDGSGKYAVSYPATVKGDINPRNVTVTVTLSGSDLQTDTSGTSNVYYYDYNGTDRTPTVTVTAIDDNALLVDSDYSVTYADNRNVGNATVTITAKAGGNYTFTDAKAEFEIRKASAVLTQSPQAKDLTYTGQPQDLVGVGTAAGGTVVYSKTGAEGSYSETIPQETNAGTYIVYYMVKGDANHSDTEPGQVSVTIKPKSFTPTITLEQDSYEYNGTAREPTVTVQDGDTEIPGPGTDKPEYSVSYQDNINAGKATVTVSDNNGGNYIVSGTANFTITKKAPTVTAPKAKTNLQYNGEKQDLVTAGVTGDGTVKYSVNGGNYTTAVPSASAVGTYAIEWKVEGDANHKDTEPAELEVKIDKNTVTNPTITLSSDQFKYTGGQQKPVITVKDDKGRLIPEEEYTVTIEGTNGNVGMVNVDTYTVKITTPDSSNYVIADDGTVNNTRTFEIVPADQETISITGTKAEVYYGDKIQLGATGGTGAGTLTWKVTDENGNPAATSTISSTGLLTVQEVGGPYTVKVTRTMENYGDVSASWEFSSVKKPVTAEVTVALKNYDGNTSVADTAITATVKAADLAFSGDSITITGLTGTYDNANVGTGKTVALTGGAVGGTNADKYDITIPSTTTASILAVPATVKENSVTAVPSLTYNASRSQALVTVEADAVTGGTMVYSLDGTNFTANIPQAKDAGTYTVRYKAQGDQNHTDSDVGTVDVTITQQSVAADKIQIELSPSSGRYDGTVQQPAVTVRDETNNVIPESEYKVTYVTDNSENWKDQGAYKVKVENITGGNYIIDTATADFEISTSAQAPLEIVNKPGLVYYGDTFTLSAVGGSASQTVTWSSSDASIADIDANGFVTIKGVGPATITAEKAGGGNYDTVQATYPFNARQKPITAIVKADDKEYDGNTNATIHVTWETGALEPGDSIGTSSVSGTFVDENAGTNKTVNITGVPVSDTTSQKYVITLPSTTTASIFKADAAAPNVTAVLNLEYTGSAKDLVTGGDTNTRYSDSRDGVYSETVPTGTKAGTYTVWYKTAGDANHNESEPRSIQVTIGPKTLTADGTNVTLSGSDLETDTSVTPNVYYYLYDGTDKTPTVIIKDDGAVVPSGEYTVSYSNHKNVGTATVTITDNEGGNYDVSGSVTFEIRKGGAQLTSSPQAVVGLTYTGQPLELVTVGTATGGHLEYRLHSETDPQPDYSTDIPTGINADTYTVDYKVVGDGNHGDGPSGSVMVTIKPKEVVSPKITVEGSYTFDGTEKKPTGTAVTVEDGTETIPDTEYTLTYRDNVNAGTATVIVSDNNGGNYTVNGTATFEIAKAASAVGTTPTGRTGLSYNGTDQELVTAGSATGGTMVYSLSETGEYTPAIPTGKTVGTHTVWYKVQGDGNHNDSEADKVEVSITVNTVSTPTVQVEPESVTYTGKKQEPTVTIWDDSGLLIDGSEYTVGYTDENGNSDLIQTGTYKLTVASKGANYDFNNATITTEFKITPAGQTPLTITGKRDRVYYGDTIQLGTEGGTEGGTVTWTVDNGSIANIIDGLLKITGVGSVTVTATSAKTGYADQTAIWSFYANPKPVEAIVTAKSKNYDGNKTAEVISTLQTSDFVGTDNFTITLTGCTFEDPNAGTDKKVNVVSTNPTFTPDTSNHENYAITYPATVTASILKAAVTNVTAPTAATGLEYTGLAQTLVKPEAAGSSPEGTMEYSLDGKTYSASLPTGTDAGDYDVWYRVKGDGNHNDTAGTKLAGQVTIAPQEVSADELIIEFEPTGASYDGQEHKPSVIVKDKNKRVIPTDEYTLSYGATDWKTAGGHVVTVTDNADGNYVITSKTETFTISMMGQNPLSIVDKPGKVQYGDSFSLSTSGGSGTGAVQWSCTGAASIDQNGLVKTNTSGAATVTATKQADSNYGAVSVTWSFSVEKKPVTPIVTARNKEYDTTDTATLVITWKDGDLVGNDSITFNPALTGKFEDANVGTNKTVNISGTKPTSDKYDVTIPSTTTASITPKVATVTGVAAKTDLVYSGSAQELVTGGTVTGGTIEYSLDGNNFSPNIPKGTKAESYTVWYKAVADNSNYVDSARKSVPVAIEPRRVDEPVIELSSATFEYDGAEKRPTVTVKDGSVVIPVSEYDVSYSDNVKGPTATVTISDIEGGNYVLGTKTATFTIQAGNAVLTIVPRAQNLTYNGSAQELVSEGAATNGKVVYSETGNADEFSPIIPTGINAGSYTVWYMVESDNGTSDTIPRSVSVTIQPKPVSNPEIVTGLEEDTVPYTGTACRPEVLAVRDGNKTIPPTEYTVTYKNNTNVGTATILVLSKGDSNYDIYASTTFEIVKAQAKFTTNPTAKTGLTYNGKAQPLVNPGAAEGGIAFYSLDGNSYSALIPTQTERGSYTVYAKVQGDSTHTDSDPIAIPVEIGINTVNNPIVELSGGPFQYNGKAHTPTVTVSDDAGNVIPAGEYTVTYSDNVEVGSTAKVKVVGKGINYSFTTEKTFTILAADETPLTITGKPDAVFYGDTFQLSATGGSGGTVTWSSSDDTVADIDTTNGVVTIKKSGSATITATQPDASGTCTILARAKPVTAIVTAKPKTYDGGTTAELAVTLSGLLPGESVTDVAAEGSFTDGNAGTGKTVIITKWTIPDAVSAKYAIDCPATTTGTITPKAATVTGVTAKTGLTYNGAPQALLENEGTADGGTIAYSVDGGSTYSFNPPTATDAGDYTVWYKVVAVDENHKDSAPAKVGPVTIAPITDTPSVTCTPDVFQYDGTEKTPKVVVTAGGHIIPEDEYTATLPSSRIAAGTYNVTVTDKPGGNYEFSGNVEGTFEITVSSQNPLSIITDRTTAYYGESFRLSAMGGSGSGAVKWSIAESSVATVNDNGVVTVIGVGTFTVEAYREASGSYDKSNTASVPLEAKPKPVTPVVTAEDKSYDGKTDAGLTATWKSGDLVGDDEIALTVTGQFATPDVGTGKKVNITSATPSGVSGNYLITWPDSVTASIYKVSAKLATKPGNASALTYTGSEQPLFTIDGTTVGNIGTVEYSTSEKGEYSTTIPTAKNAGTYEVWYKVADSENYTGIAPAFVEVEIQKATPTISTNPTASGSVGKKLIDITLSGGATDVPGTFAWKNGDAIVESGKTYPVVFTPNDADNYNSVEFQISATSTVSNDLPIMNLPSAPSADNAASAPAQIPAQDNAASATVSAGEVEQLVQEALENQSDNIVVKPDMSGDATRAEVSLPAETVNRIVSETDASLTVSTPIADATIPQEALETLGRAGDVSVVTEQVDQTVVLRLTAGGEDVESVPGGVTLSVPVENAGPGTVAVLVREDGTRETISKSTVADGKVIIPLDGSATVEIVDNSKAFEDVPEDSWAADAVAFASAREMFSGTSETTFSPDESMSRGMLATVLYNLEGRPEQEVIMQDLEDGYSDVDGGAWYAEGVAWATENGIVNGYGNGAFGPDDSVTREQLAVMLWKYAGSPEASDKALDFTDADQANSYAQEALRWAVESGILNGYADGRLAPGGTATRAEAAQMLKNFMERA